MAPDLSWFTFGIGYLLMSKGDGNSAQFGAGKTARLARLVRLVRLVRIVKIYSMLKKKDDAKEEEKLRAQARMAANAKQAALKRVEASRLGKVLSEQMTRKVIVAILLMLFTMPYLKAEEADLSKEWGLQTLFWFGSSDCSLIRSIVEEHKASTWAIGAAE